MEKVKALILFTPFILIGIAVLIYQINFPRESALFGKRWQFQNEDLEPSEESMRFNLIMAIVGLVIAVLMVIGIVLSV